MRFVTIRTCKLYATRAQKMEQNYMLKGLTLYMK